GPGPPAEPTPGSAHHRPRLSRDAATERSITIPRKALVPITIARVDRVPPVARARTDSFLTLSFLARALPFAATFLFAFLAMGADLLRVVESVDSRRGGLDSWRRSTNVIPLSTRPRTAARSVPLLRIADRMWAV